MLFDVKNDVIVAFANKKIDIKKFPHQSWKNLNIIIYAIDNDGNSWRVTYDDLKENNISEQMLFSYAKQNTRKRFNFVMANLSDVTLSIMTGIGIDFAKKYSVNELDEVNFKDEFMYTLSNEKFKLGAIAIFFEDVLEKIAEKFNSDLYILPSSIHETMIVPKNKFSEEDKSEELAKMVKEINADAIKPYEQLSDSCYLYNKDTKEIKITTN